MSVFLLVEDSAAMERLWPAIRDRGLQPLLESLQRRTPVPTSLAVVRETQSGLSELRHYNDAQRGLADIVLYGGGEGYGGVSTTGMQKSVQKLAQICAQKGGSAAQHAHFVVAAASTAFQAVDGSPEGIWTSLAAEAARFRILPHLILGQGADVPGLLMFFTTLVRLQGAGEDAVRFRDAAFSVRTSTRSGAVAPGADTATPSDGPSLESPHGWPRHSVPDAPASDRRAGPSSSFHQHPLPPIQIGPPLPHTRSPNSRSRKASLPEAPRPTLVSQLQHLHGLSKKRIYGAKPARRPYFRDEDQRGSGGASEARGHSLREEEPSSEPASPTRARYAALPAAPSSSDSGGRDGARAPPRREHQKDMPALQPTYNPPPSTRARVSTAEANPAHANRPTIEPLARDRTAYGEGSSMAYPPVPPAGFESSSTSAYGPVSPSAFSSASPPTYAPIPAASRYGTAPTTASYVETMNPAAYNAPPLSTSYQPASASAGYGAVPSPADYSAGTSSAGYGAAPLPPDPQRTSSWSSFTPAAPSSGHGGAGYGGFGAHDFDATYGSWSPNTYASAPPSPTQGYTYLPFGVADSYAAQAQDMAGPGGTSARAPQPSIVHPRPSMPSGLPPPPDPAMR
ncbi:hypothetical protein HDZ31DRAFT_40135 [Schizophyllum fasciatum]